MSDADAKQVSDTLDGLLTSVGVESHSKVCVSLSQALAANNICEDLGRRLRKAEAKTLVGGGYQQTTERLRWVSNFHSYQHLTIQGTRTSLRRGQDERFNDNELAQAIYDATEAVARAPQPNNMAPCLRAWQMGIIERARNHKVCTLNEYRAYLGLKRTVNVNLAEYAF